MNILSTYVILSLIQFSIYLYLKGSLNNLKFSHYLEHFRIFQDNDRADNIPEPEQTCIATKLTNQLDLNEEIILNKSLKHLEFISKFEMYLEEKNFHKFPIEFLQEFDKIKIEAQLTTLKTTSQLTNVIKQAA